MNETNETAVVQRNSLTLRQAAERLNASETFVRREIYAGNLPAWKKGGKELMVEPADLDEYIELQNTKFRVRTSKATASAAL